MFEKCKYLYRLNISFCQFSPNSRPWPWHDPHILMFRTSEANLFKLLTLLCILTRSFFLAALEQFKAKPLTHVRHTFKVETSRSIWSNRGRKALSLPHKAQRGQEQRCEAEWRCIYGVKGVEKLSLPHKAQRGQEQRCEAEWRSKLSHMERNGQKFSQFSQFWFHSSALSF